MWSPGGKAFLFLALLGIAGYFPPQPSQAGPSAPTQEPQTDTRPKGVLFKRLAPPKGFDDLTQPQEVVVDLFFTQRLIGSTTAIITPDWLRFVTPEAIPALIPGLDPASTSAVRTALSGELPHHTELSCYPHKHQGCGYLPTESAAIIYTPDRFRVELFVATNLMSKVKRDPFLPLPDSGFSTILGLYGAVTGSDAHGGSTQGSLTSRLLTAYNEYNLNGTFVYDQDQNSHGHEFQVDELVGQRISGPSIYSLGFFPLQNLAMIADQNILGFGITSTIRTRRDEVAAQAQPIPLFLYSRSRVNVRKDGRLLSSQSYESGNQLLDTTLLPTGAYEIELEIIDSNGSTRRETRFINKSSRMPLVDQPLWAAQLGVLRNKADDATWPAVENIPVLRLGGSKRIHDQFALGANLVASKKQTLAEGLLQFQGKSFYVDNAYLTSTEGDFGVAAQSYGSLGGLNFSAGLRQIWAGKVEPANSRTIQFDPITQDESQYSLNLNYFVNDWQFGLNGNWRKLGEQPETYAYGPTLRWWFYHKNNLNGSIEGSMTRTERDTSFMLNVVFSFYKNHWNISSTVGNRWTKPARGDPQQDLLTNTSLSWEDSEPSSHDFGITARHQYDGSAHLGGLEVKYANNYGRAEADVNHGNAVTSYGANLSFTLAESGRTFVVGGRENNDSGVLIDIESADSAATYLVMINDNPWGKVKGGTKTPIFLTPLQDYRVRLAPGNEVLTTIDMREREVVLYPGNMAHLRWEARETLVIIGRLVDGKDRPLRGALVESSVEKNRADSEGNLQISAYLGERLRVRPTQAQPCSVETSRARPRSGIAFVDKLVCRSEPH